MSLAEYRKKRDFEKTPEPEAQVKGASGHLYVIQKHDASRLHYDFRLELDGVLKSWAVPKGPSLDPHERRLAVQVEDHPVDYGAFEGIIPEGEYGGGTVMLWDRGTWEPIDKKPLQALESGKLKFALHGEKLRGVWNLVRLPDGKNWLLIKSRDDEASEEGDILHDDRSVATGRSLDAIASSQDAVWHGQTPDPSDLTGARKARQPSQLEPQLARLSTEIPRGDVWVHELKHDGYRILAFLDKGKVVLRTRTHQDWTHRYGPVVEALKELPVNQAILDGEIVMLRPDGTSDFQALQQGRGELAFYVFDLPFCEGYDLRDTPLLERKLLLQGLLLPGSAVRFSDHLAGQGDDFFAQACAAGAEGIISKRGDAGYASTRNGDWLKIKCKQAEEFVVGGWSDPSGSRQGLGALLVGVFEEEELVYRGKVGTGFNARSLQELSQALARLDRKTSPFKNPPRGKGLHWVTPKLVVQVEYAEQTREGILRHPSFKGLREDKPADEVTAPDEEDDVDEVKISNPDRKVYPDVGVTKLEIADYYRSVADRMLPHLVNRPLAIMRCPRGMAEKCFYHKHRVKGFPAAVKAVEVQEREGPAEHLMITDQEGLISLVQFGTLEFHPWGCSVGHLDKPDRMVLDLDPAEDVEWKEVVSAAHEVRERLDSVGLQSFCKTTGGKGLHIVVPLQPKVGWDAMHAFSQTLVEFMVRENPKKYVEVMTKAKRHGKIYLDFQRNGHGATAVAAYSTRARDGALVATPLTWEEVTAELDPRKFTVHTVPERDDPWPEFFNLKQRLPS